MALSVEELVKHVTELAGAKDRIVASTGLLARVLYAREPDSERCFYMIGSLGLALSLGAGIAASRKDVRVIVLDGDGSVLMGLASLVLAADLRPVALHHVVVANGRYASTGGQELPGRAIQLGQLATATGYSACTHVKDAHNFIEGAYRLWSQSGPTLIEAEVELSNTLPPRVAVDPADLARRFRENLLRTSYEGETNGPARPQGSAHYRRS